jgi:hypothetical protein
MARKKNYAAPKCNIQQIEVNPSQVLGKDFFVYETFRRLMSEKHHLENEVIRLLFERSFKAGIIVQDGFAGTDAPRYKVVKKSSLPAQQRIFEEKEG